MAEFDKYDKQQELWIDSRMITADVALAGDQVKKILPLGMWLTEKPTGSFFIVDYRQPNFTAPYREAALLVHVKTLFGRGLHCVWMTVDDDTAMIYGRELLGYPKKMANMKFEQEKSTISASVTRRGTTVLAMHGRKKDIQSNPLPVFDKKMFNVGGLGNLLLLQTIWMSRSCERITESCDAEVELSLLPSKSDPLLDLVESSSTSHGRIVMFDIIRGKYLFPVGLAGPLWFARTRMLRMR